MYHRRFNQRPRWWQGVSGMGGMMKGRMHVRDHADTTHSLLEMYVSPRAYSFHFSPQAYPTRRRSLWPLTSCQYALHVLFISTPSPNGTLDDTAAPACNPYPFVHKPNTLDGGQIVVPAGCGLGRLGPDRGVARRLRRESVG